HFLLEGGLLDRGRVGVADEGGETVPDRTEVREAGIEAVEVRVERDAEAGPQRSGDVLEIAERITADELADAQRGGDARRRHQRDAVAHGAGPVYLVLLEAVQGEVARRIGTCRSERLVPSCADARAERQIANGETGRHLEVHRLAILLPEGDVIG